MIPAGTTPRKLGEKSSKILLIEYFTELLTVAKLTNSYLIKDEFNAGYEYFKKTGKIPFSLVFTE